MWRHYEQRFTMAVLAVAFALPGFVFSCSSPSSEKLDAAKAEAIEQKTDTFEKEVMEILDVHKLDSIECTGDSCGIAPLDTTETQDVGNNQEVEFDAPVVPVGTCADFQKCMDQNNCDIGSPECIEQCKEGLNQNALEEIDAVFACLDQQCKDAENPGLCMYTKCFDKLIICIAGEGQGTCIDVIDCISACPEGSDPCFINCMALGNEDSVAPLVEMFSDSEGHNFFKGLLSCIPATGEADCGQTVNCIIPCFDESPQAGFVNLDCLKTCVQALSPDYLDLTKQVFSCGEEPCIDKLVLCVGGKGEQDCAGTMACVEACGENNDQCFFNCLAQTSQQGAEQVANFFACIIDKCGGFGNECEAFIECIDLCPGYGTPE